MTAALRLVTERDRDIERTNADIVAALKHALECAERSEFSGLVIAATCWNGGMFHCITSADDRPKLIAALAMVQHRQLNKYDESTTGPW